MICNLGLACCPIFILINKIIVLLIHPTPTIPPHSTYNIQNANIYKSSVNKIMSEAIVTQEPKSC